MMRKPPPLRPGDKVGIFLPSSPVRQEYRDRGLAEIRALGFIPVEAEEIMSGPGQYTAKHPDQMLEDIRRFLADRTVRALWAARGGYGSNLMLGRLNSLKGYEPRIVIGSSDASYLLWGIMEELKMPVFYGPMAYASVADRRFDRDLLLSILSGDYEEIRVPAPVLKPGKTEAVLTGGCLSNLVSLCGTGMFPPVRGRILLLEDINERPYRIDRMIWQLSKCGVLSEISGIVFGEFPGCFNNEGEKEDLFKTILKYFEEYKYPVIYDLPFGHAGRTAAVPLGIPVLIDTSRFEGLIIRDKGVSRK